MKENPQGALKAASRLSKELGIPLDNFLHDIQKLKQNFPFEREFIVLCMDKYDGSNRIYGLYKTAGEALNIAKKMTRESMESASHHPIDAIVYLAYDPSGKCLGGEFG